MKGAVLYGPGDVRVEERDAPTIVEPTDAIIRLSATCVCGSDLWDYRGINPITQPKPMGHEYCGIVEDVGRAVTSVKPGQFVIGSFFASDNTCPDCRAGYQSSCQHREFVGGAQAPRLRVPHGVELNGQELFYAHVHLHGGPAPVRRFLPGLIDLVWDGKINPGKVFDLTLPLDQVAEGYRAMDERRAIKALLRPQAPRGDHCGNPGKAADREGSG